LVISDLLEAKHGTLSAPWEWFKVWKGIEDEDEKNEGMTQLEILTKGIFHKIRILDIIENFIVYEGEGQTFIKKIPLYHQYYGVNKAVQYTLKATAPSGNKKIGVFWHSQGSGKSLSMVFYTNKVKKLKQLKNPTLVFLTDRNDLDQQLYKTFLRSGYPYAKQTESIKDLNLKLRNSAGDIIFTTIQKFQSEPGEEFPLLCDRENVIVIADEAHRSEYAKLAGNVRFALPNASFIGFTGTPISLHDRNTTLVFGDYISIYPINQSVEDGATVKIYYESRLVSLHLSNMYIDEEFEDITEEIQTPIKESLKRKWARLEAAVSAKDRLKKIAEDIVWHFYNRQFDGKAMIVTISRKVAVELYQMIKEIPHAPEIAVVISGIDQYREKIQKEIDIKELERRFKDPNDPLKMVIVCDMWLTGFDIPCLHTMYIDKPLKNHTLMQAIARVNRIYKDKQGGLIVDYIGIADDLKKSLSIYSSKIREEALVPLNEAITKMLEKYDIVKSYLVGIDFFQWKKLSGTPELTRLLQKAINQIITDPQTGKSDEERQKKFIREVTVLSKLFVLVSPHKEANEIRDEVEFFQLLKRTIVKRIITIIDVDEDIDTAVRELISKSIAAEGVLDLFDSLGKEKPEISIFNEKFLEDMKNLKYKNLSIQVLKKLLNDEIKVRMRKNVVRFESLIEILEKIIEKYENNLINSSQTIEQLINLAKEIQKAESEGVELGLTDEELAFYDALAKGKKHLRSNKDLKETVIQILQEIKKDLTIDWENNEVIKARMRADVRRVLLRKGIEPEEVEIYINDIMRQAYTLYKEWPGEYKYAYT
jgi:type I restriction enzyme R subunit